MSQERKPNPRSTVEKIIALRRFLAATEAYVHALTEWAKAMARLNDGDNISSSDRDTAWTRMVELKDAWFNGRDLILRLLPGDIQLGILKLSKSLKAPADGRARYDQLPAVEAAEDIKSLIVAEIAAADLPPIHVPGAMRVETTFRSSRDFASGPGGGEEAGVQGQSPWSGFGGEAPNDAGTVRLAQVAAKAAGV